MKHYGDITKIDGHDVEIVDVVCGGSPCQDLSVAGKRAGLAGERSGLFMEQIRIIKEMREHDRELHGRGADVPIRPRYMVWENVPGAFSSAKGEDFAAVIEETIKVVEPEIPHINVPEKGWSYSGCYYDEMGKWSVAWRVHDAQFWGVPQRRKRIALVADFGGLSAPEILFERKGLSRNFDESITEGKGTSADTQGGSDSAIGIDGYNQSVTGDKAKSITSRASDSDHIPITLKVRGGGVQRDSNGKSAGKGALIQTDLSGTLGASQDQTLFCLEGTGTRPSHHGKGYNDGNPMFTLNTTELHGVAYGFDQGASRDVGELFLQEKAKTISNGSCPGHHNGVCVDDGSEDS